MASLDDAFDLLSRERRGYALYGLEAARGPLHITTLAERISELEDDPGTSKVRNKTYDDVLLSLRHAHVPKAATVEYDPDSGFVEISGSPRSFRALLHVAEVIERPDLEDISELA